VKVDAFPDRLSTPVFDNLNLNRGLVYEVGERQRAQKKVCRPSFSNSACLETFLEAIKQETSTLADRWRTEGAAGKRAPSHPDDASPPRAQFGSVRLMITAVRQRAQRVIRTGKKRRIEFSTRSVMCPCVWQDERGSRCEARSKLDASP